MSTYAVPDALTGPLIYQVKLDGASYTIKIFFLYFGQRNYITITNQYGYTVVTMPLIASPKSGNQINMLAGYFTTSTLFYYPTDQIIEILP